MNKLIDVINFNADASCLFTSDWLRILSGGVKSEFYSWLNLYVIHKKKAVLGIPGSTISDISSFNPESIELINKHPEIFEIIARPYAHDIALLRTEQGFKMNLDYGLRAINKEFKNYTPYFLPPEFICTNSQINLLQEKNIQGVFINHIRFASEIGARIPSNPYYIKGLFGHLTRCITFTGDLYHTYLYALHYFDNERWNTRVSEGNDQNYFCWRDGESIFLIPDGLKREEYWLTHEHGEFERAHISEAGIRFTQNEELDENAFRSYPIHSFTAWMKELRTLGYISRMQEIEKNLGSLSKNEIHLWLQVINSDILSSIEKSSPVIKLKPEENEEPVDFTIWRSERGFEGEEYITLLEDYKKPETLSYINKAEYPHTRRLKSRMKYLTQLDQHG